MGKHRTKVVLTCEVEADREYTPSEMTKLLDSLRLQLTAVPELPYNAETYVSRTEAGGWVCEN